MAAGKRARYGVVFAPHAPEPQPEVPAEVGKLVGKQTTLELRATDVYGNLYALDLSGNPEGAGFGSRRVLKSGPATLSSTTLNQRLIVKGSLRSK